MKNLNQIIKDPYLKENEELHLIIRNLKIIDIQKNMQNN